MYGSSFMCVTRSPRASINAPIDADVSPLPIEETTPPVTNTNLVRRLTGGTPCRTCPYHALTSPAPLPHIYARCLGNLGHNFVTRVRRGCSKRTNHAEAHAVFFEIEGHGAQSCRLRFLRRRFVAR